MRVAIYARVSSEQQEKDETIQSQLSALREHVKRNAFTLVEEYLDDGYSGELLDRPGLDKLRDDAKRKLFDAVLIHSPDRLSRVYWHRGLLVDELKKNNVAFIFLNMPDAKDTAEERLSRMVLDGIAEYEKTKIMERTRRGRLHKAQSNIIVGSRPPYGYRYVRIDAITHKPGHYMVNEAEAKVVRLIFELFVQDRLSIRAIAKELTKRGIPPQRGIHWRTSSLHRVLRNETYAGVTHYNKNYSTVPEKRRDASKPRRAVRTSSRLRPKDKWIAITLPEESRIIDNETFQLAQAQLIKNSEFSPRNTKHEYLLKNIIRCGRCDAPMYGENSRGKLYYRCGDRARTFPLPRKCEACTVRTNKIEKVVWDKFCEAVQNPKLIAEQVMKLKEKGSRIGFDGKIEALNKEIEALSLQANRVLDAYRENVITLEQLKEQMAKSDAQKKQLEADRLILTAKQAQVLSLKSARKSITDYCQLVRKNLKRAEGDFSLRRQIVTLAIPTIRVEDKTVRIKCIIPAYVQESPADLSICASMSSEGCDFLPRQSQGPF